MTPRGRLLAPLLAILLGLGLPFEAEAAPECRTIHVVDHGYHTGLFVAARDLDPAGWLGTDAFREARWLEIGWGDAAFYQTPDPSFAMALSALFASEESVLHVVAHAADPAAVFPTLPIVTLQVSVAGYERMMRRLQDAFMRETDGTAIETGASSGGRSRFFRAKGDYSIAYTCNNWMADLLVEAGVPIDPTGTSLSSDLMDKLADVEGQPCRARAG